MQMEMEMGGSPLFFNLFVAMVNHLVSITSYLLPEYHVTDRCLQDDIAGARSPR